MTESFPGDFPAAALETLELPAVLVWIAESAVTPPGRRELLEARPGLSPELLAARRGRGRDAVEALRAEQAPRLRRAVDLGALSYTAHQRVLDGVELAELAATLELLEELRGWGRRHAAAYPSLAAAAAGVPDVAALLHLLQQTVDERGQVRDEADPALAAVRKELRELHERRGREVEAVAEDWQQRGWLQNRRPVQRGGRLTLAVRSVHQGRARGLVHDRSQTGDTVFLEPAGVVLISNRIADEEIRENQIVHRVLSAASREVSRRRSELEEAGRRLGQVDFACAAAHWCQARNGLYPEMPAPSLELRGARHPLLLRERSAAQVVPLDLSLGGAFDLLVVTGPNTGGKTVVLKTVGLLAALACAGLPVTAESGTAFPELPGLDADIGDPQSLQNSLSTFSGHLQRLLRILRHCRRGTLVLLDELGTGTDPEEGAALGQALLEHLLQRGARVLANTHLGHLKLFSLRVPRAENASMEFDPATLSPRFRLLVGVPGASHALEVAEGLGLPPPILERARALARRGDSAERLIAEVAGVRREAELLRERARDSETGAREALQRAAAVEEETAQRVALRQEEAAMAYRELHAGLEGLVRGPGQALLSRVKGAERDDLERLFALLRELMTRNEIGARWQEFLRSLRKGDVVYVPRYRERLPVLRVDAKNQRIKVRHGQLDIEVPFHELSWVAPPPGNEPA